MSEKQAIAAIKQAKSEDITKFRVELYDRDNDYYGNPNSNIDVWADGDLIYSSKRRSQLGYGPLDERGYYLLSKVFESVKVISESGDINSRSGVRYEYRCHG